MVRELLTILPESWATAPAPVIAAMVGGLILWAAGARISRSVVTLAAVAGGTLVSMRVPAWFGWPINPMGAGIGGAIVFGVGGYLLHKILVALLAGVVIATWAVVGTWLVLSGGAEWNWPSLEWGGGVLGLLRAVWSSVPEPLRQAAPCAAAGGFTSGVALSFLWPRLARILTYSLTGAGILLATGLPMIQAKRPAWLDSLPNNGWSQAGMTAGMVVLGAVVQWWLIAGGAGDAPAKGGAPKGAPAEASA